MLKLILSAALTMAVSVAAADSSKPETVTATGKMPVIIKNEMLKPGLCRLHFENGESREVSCQTSTDKQ